MSLPIPKYTYHAPIKNADMCILYYIMQRVTKSRRMRLAGCVAQRNTCKVLVGKPERKRKISRPSHRWEKNITGILQKLEGRVWTGFFRLRIGRSDRLM